MKVIYEGIGLVIWKAGALIGIPYAKKKLEDRGGEVGARGFEPRTSATQRQRATRLRHAPSRSES